jgi:hypothetical protein
VRLFVVIGLIFAPMAALCAFLITYNEYAHHYSNRRPPLMHALQAGLFAFVVFMAVSLLVGYFAKVP